jgi:TRAP-type uncharacterized transport system substrate-binding protein
MKILFLLLTTIFLAFALVASSGQQAQAEEKTDGTQSESSSPKDVTLKLKGDSKIKVSGTCTVGGQENTISGQVPQSLAYNLDGQKLECKIQKRKGANRNLKIVLAGKNIHAVQQINSRNTVINLTYDGSSVSLSTSSSGSTHQVQSSSSSSSVSSEQQALT